MATAQATDPERSTARRRLAASAVFLSLGVVIVAERDLATRPAARVRGPRPLWRLVATNAPGALAYLSWGRRA